MDDDNTHLAAAIVDTRDSNANGEEQDVESILDDLEGSLLRYEHSRSRQAMTGIVSSPLAMLPVLIVLFIALQAAIRVWVAQTGDVTAALYPYGNSQWQVGGIEFVADGEAVGMLVVWTIRNASLGAAVTWYLAMVWLHKTWDPWTFLTDSKLSTPTRSYSNRITMRTISEPSGERTVLLETTDRQLLYALSKGYDSITLLDDATAETVPPSALDRACAKNPTPLIMKFEQPTRTQITGEQSAWELRACEKLLILADELPCLVEVQIIVSNGCQSYTVPVESDEKTSLSTVLAQYRAFFNGESTVEEDDQRVFWTANIRVIACPRTADERDEVYNLLDACSVGLPNSPAIESSVTTVTPEFENWPKTPPRFPRVQGAGRFVANHIGTRPEKTGTETRGLLTPLRFWIGSLVDNESTLSTAAALSNRQIRAARHDDVRINPDQTDLLVSREALASLLVARRDTTEELANALDDDIRGETLDQTQEDDFVVEPDEVSTNDRPAAHTDGGTHEASPDRDDSFGEGSTDVRTDMTDGSTLSEEDS